MISTGIVDLSSDDKKKNIFKHEKSKTKFVSQGLDAVQSTSSILDQVPSPASPLCPAPVFRQFWKAGNYDDGVASKVNVESSYDHLHVHPMFLHSNATSHKWVFGAVAELLDNAVDEIQNGATFVNVDKILNARDGSPALLIQDDGGGMDPEAMRRCMNFGFSDKSESSIGKCMENVNHFVILIFELLLPYCIYWFASSLPDGNGFKTSTMRLGADAIVFSRHMNDRVSTQSIGLLSYTFLTCSGYNRIVVPMVDYEYNTSSGKMELLHGKEHFTSNLSKLLQWSPYSTEAELLKQFDDIGSHGTKVIIYNLWYNGDQMELDFETDPEDICISGDKETIDTHPVLKAINEQHIANRLQYSLREYLSILYLRLSENFKIVLRGRVVLHRNLADDLKFLEYILYKPREGVVVTTIGFLKEAPRVSIHGFNVYHKNRLILPFWRAVSYSDNSGRGVVGVLEANFIEPTHNKQDFERTSLFQKLEVRLKSMTWEYWDYHCDLIGYQARKHPRVTATSQTPTNTVTDGKRTSEQCTNSKGKPRDGVCIKRKADDLIDDVQMKRKKDDVIEEGQSVRANELEDQRAIILLEQNKKLHAKCSEYEKREEELNLKAMRLRSDVREEELQISWLLEELKSLEAVKAEGIVQNV